MTGSIYKSSDFLTGLFFSALGCMLTYIAAGYRLGTAQRMGPGYFPLVLSGLLVVFGLILIARSFRAHGSRPERLAIRPMVFVLLAALLFGLLIRPAGLLLATAAVVVVGSLASREAHLRTVLVATLVLTFGSAIIFVYLLGQPLPVVGYWFG